MPHVRNGGKRESSCEGTVTKGEPPLNLLRHSDCGLRLIYLLGKMHFIGYKYWKSVFENKAYPIDKGIRRAVRVMRWSIYYVKRGGPHTKTLNGIQITTLLPFRKSVDALLTTTAE